MLRFSVKSAILGSAVYYTVDKGVWKDSATTAALYEELDKGMSPYVNELKSYSPVQLPPLPSSDSISYLFKYYWNTGVKNTFTFILDLPEYTISAGNSAYKMIASTFEDVSATDNTK